MSNRAVRAFVPSMTPKSDLSLGCVTNPSVDGHELIPQGGSSR
jgi:hypothetical protein